MAQMTSATGSLPLRLSKGETLVIKDLAGSHTVTGSLAPREDASASVGAGFVVYGPQSSAVTVTISTTGAVDYQVVSGDVSPASSATAGVTRYVSKGATFEEIVAIASEVAANGGGHVVFMPTTYNIGDNTLPVLQGVYYEGVGLASTMEDRALRFGTLIKSTSTTKPVFGYNFVDRGSRYSTSAEFFDKNLLGAGIRHLNIEGGAFGVKVGALHECGVENFVLRDVCSFAAFDTGIHLENCHIVSVKNVISYEHRRAGFIYYTSGAGLWNHGQNDIQHVVCQSGIRNAHGAIIGARGLNSSLNDTHVNAICTIGGGSEFTETVTITAGSPDIPVSDLSKYALGVGVQFTGTLGTVTGLSASSATALTTYFVVAVSGTSGAGTIRVSIRFGGTEITPGGTGTASVSLGGRGGCGIVWGGDYTHGVPGAGTSCTIRGIDTEANGTVEFYVGRMTYSHALMGILRGGAPGASALLNSATLVIRDVSFDMFFECPKRPDGIDWDGSGQPQFTGASPIRGSTLPGTNYNPLRFGNQLNLSSEGIAMYANRHGDAGGLRPLTGIGTALQLAQSETTETLQQGAHTSCVTYRGGGATYTLRGTSHAKDECLGYIVNWFNYNATAVTLDGGGLNIEGLGTSSATISVPGKTGVMLQLRKANGTYFWARFV